MGIGRPGMCAKYTLGVWEYFWIYGNQFWELLFVTHFYGIFRPTTNFFIFLPQTHSFFLEPWQLEPLLGSLNTFPESRRLLRKKHFWHQLSLPILSLPILSLPNPQRTNPQRTNPQRTNPERTNPERTIVYYSILYLFIPQTPILHVLNQDG